MSGCGVGVGVGVAGTERMQAGLARTTHEKRYFAQTMQWIMAEGVLRMVQAGNVLAFGLGWHS